ncbi:MAG TPA: metalloregulator ArsR/SmtB family transcription factor [Candidatus Limosilactobacillus merdigallinarum]|uniref:Metalloregulator ArsR/SmtB family transcription factor n=1 Tax=Candidatus Limosilactobacillus merdigallinarum TaxID=2838652 RepID=A0A9D2AKU2_9LACO|nr:metalloregulator ArsR/SmtB family transcription factor [Candidatus Limosilactobacillus merdigallinarum]
MKIPNDLIDEAAKIYGVLSNSTRIKILYFLYYQENDVPVNEIVQNLGMAQPVVSRQLAILRQYQLVRFHREGKQVFYVVDDPHVVEMINDMLNHVKHEIKGLPHPKN